MNGVRRFLATTVQGSSTPSSPTTATGGDFPPAAVEKSTSWVPQLSQTAPLNRPGAEPLVKTSELRRDSSSSTIGAKETMPLALSTPGAGSSNAPIHNASRSSIPATRSSPSASPAASARSSRAYSRSSPESKRIPPVPVRPQSGTRTPSRPPPLQKRSSPAASHYSLSKSPQSSWKAASAAPVNTRDDLLMMLLTSQAVLDSRDFEILSAEEVDELKNEHAILQKRITALSKRVTLESKIRDAASSLSKLPGSPSKRASQKQTAEQLAVAAVKVDNAKGELSKASDRAAEVQRRLLEHRAAVLSFTVRSSEKPSPTDGGDLSDGTATTNLSGELSPVSTAPTSLSASSRSKFEGPHLFAGHVDAVVPGPPRPPPTWNDIASLQEQLDAATEAATAAKRKAAEYQRELSVLDLEKNEIETKNGLEIQISEERISSLEAELGRMAQMRQELEDLRAAKVSFELEQASLQDTLRSRDAALTDLQTSSGTAMAEEHSIRDSEIQQLKTRFESEVTLLQAELSEARNINSTSQHSLEELEAGRGSLLDLAHTLNVILPSQNASLSVLAGALAAHIGLMSSKLEAHDEGRGAWETERKQLEAEIRKGAEARERLLTDIEDARREREELRAENRSLENKLRDQPAPAVPIVPSNLPPGEVGAEHERVITLLQTLWSSLPSPEARAKVGIKASASNPKTPKSPAPSSSSLSDLDVRALKSLYEAPTPTYPAPPSLELFSIEGFVERVQALMSDDKALVERLIRFAQGHDLLKSNAERARKLAQESSVGLETYQKQVKTLEERNAAMTLRQAELTEDINQLQDALELALQQKQDMEIQAAEQAQALEELQEANNTLSARALTLAAEAAEAVAAPDASRGQLEAKIASLSSDLSDAREELDRIRSAEQAQRIQLLDELNTMQTENGALRTQLRAEQRKNSTK